MFYLYLILTGALTLVFVSNLFRERGFVPRLSYALMIIPFLLRTLAIK